MIKSENETLNKKVFSRWRKVERDAENTMSSGKLFQIFEAATGNALLSTVFYSFFGFLAFTVHKPTKILWSLAEQSARWFRQHTRSPPPRSS